MKGSRVHFLTPLVIIAVWVIILASTGRADDISNPVQVWPAFHADMMHVGRNPHSTDLENPASLGPIWVFPRPDAAYATEADTAVDDFGDGNSWFTQYYGRWKQDTNEDAWESRFASDIETDDTSTPRYHYLTAVLSDAAANLKDKATWTFPYGDANRPTVSLGYYYVWVWVPIAPDGATYSFTRKAVYTVYDDSGTTQVTFDQSDGGSWQLLSTEQFSFRDKTKTHAVELSNVTEDAISTVRVAADAVKFVRGTGMEIYSSPVSATIDYEMTPDPTKASNYKTAQEGFDGKAPVVYIGTVEKPLTKDTNAPDLGALYCVNSVTPTNNTLAVDSKYEELSERLGTAIWRYPSRVLRPDETKPPWEPDPRDRDPLEGPIEGGIYSTPTLARVVIGEETKLVCFVTGSDRQIYALDATTGELLWKGPGMTVSEQANSGWTEVTNRDDAFGGSLRYATSSSSSTPMIWTFDAAKLSATRGGKVEGWAYSVYAWIPPVGYGETDTRGTGKYTISCQDRKYSITIDQSKESSQGKWVTLATSCFNVTQVDLSPLSKQPVVADAVMVVPNTIGSFSYCSPVVDIPLSMTDTNYDSTVSTLNATTIYAVTATGRALSFTAEGQGSAEDHLGEVNWVYPKIRSKANVTGSDDADQPAMGLIGATPTYWDKGTPYLYVAALDGNIHCIDTTTGELAWKFFDKDTSDNFGDSVSVGGFTSTPTIDDSLNQLFIGSTTGYFYCIDAENGPDSNGKPLWRYPDYSSSKVPLGAFRYSTAVVGDASDGKSGSSEKHRVWIGSVDGHVYSFNAENNTINADDRRLWVEYPTETTRDIHGGVDYTELALMSSIQGSIAIDGAAPNDPTRYTRTSDKANVDVYNTMTMYAGDMDGKLHWLSANSGRSDWYYDSANPKEKQIALKTSGKGKNYRSFQTEGALFSSPNITHFKYSATSNTTSYVYEGCADGRVYAFSDYGGAWGGGWAGGEYWPFSSDLESLKSEGLAPDAEVQCEIFPTRLYTNSQKFNPQTSIPAPATSPDMYSRPIPGASGTDWLNWSDTTGKWIVSPEMKEVKTVPLSTTGPVRDTEIDAALFSAAQQQRYIDSDNCYVGGTNRSSNKPVYFEWGETINVILWNLPERQFLKGRGSSAFTLTMMNASGGTSAGGSIVVNSGFKVKEYNVLDAGSAVGNTAPLLKYDDGRVVKRSYMYYSFKLNYEKTSKGNPPSPGPGWILKVDVLSRESTSSTAAYTRKTYPVARLMSGSPYKPFVADEIYQEQDLGVNNPLAIRDDQATLGGIHTSESLAWPANNVFTTDRNNAEAHYNGNAVGDNITYSAGVLPIVDLGTVNHGTPSRQARLWVMDRSAVGTTQNSSGSPNKLKRFRIDADELNWNGGTDALTNSGGTKFPWEFDIGSADYPNITQQYQSYQKASDGADPANNSTELPCVYDTDGTAPLDYNKCTMQPDIVLVAANVPRFQPANIYGAGLSNSGYSRRMEVYVDSDGDGVWDTPDVVIGRQSGYQEAYRRFSTGVRVPPDPQIEVEEQTIDVGKAPHGLGLGLTGNQEFSPFNPSPDVAQWFKTVTIKNAGNVNIPDIYIGRQVRMYSDQAGSVSPVPINSVTSSLDWGVSGEFSVFKQPPYTTAGYGYTLTKSKVGDPDPSILTIPDKRKWDMDNGDAKTTTQKDVTDLNTAFHASLDSTQPLPVKVSVKVPLTQPIGAYHSYESSYGLPFVPVFADLNGDGALSAYEPYAQTSFQLNASVRENQLTGGVTPMTLPQIDSDSVARLGDSTPAAFRDITSGNVYLFWSSNRMFDSKMYPDWTSVTGPKRTDFANAPWFIDRATLNWHSGDWQSQTTPNQWWKVPTDPAIATLPSAAEQWPTAISTPMKWTLGGSETDFYSVRHHSPVIARTLKSNSVVEEDPTWLVWAGDADIKKSDNKITQDHLIFYTKATGGDVTSSDNPINYIKHDPATIKRSPSMAIFNDRAWMFWQGGNDGKLSIVYSTNESASLSMDGWADDSVLRTPDCLSSVSSPNCIFRRFWGSLTSDSDYSSCKQLLDIIYAGTDKYTQNSDILLGRYIAANQTNVDAQTNSNDKAALKDALPSSMAQPLPRVFDEKLKRDPKYGFYMSQHLAWIRPNFESLVTDSWGREKYTASDTDAPYIHVVLPKNYVLPDGITVAYKNVVSATDGSIRSIDASGNETVDVEPSTPVCTYDEATGIYTYKYSNATTKAILGDMLVDFSAGTVRFTESLKETQDGDSFIAPEIRADYTPQTWRITTDEAVDNSPRAFIERTNMNTTTNPGFDPDFSGSSAPIDRLWVFWRKAGTGVKTSTIYYKTYRVGVDLTKLGYAPIPMITQRSVSGAAIGHVDPAANLSVEHERGPWEVNRAGTKIYFSEVDERYQSLKKSGYSGLVPLPTDITISYNPSNSSSSSAVTVTAKDISWIEETPEQLGFSADGNVNEDSIYAFADPGYPNSGGTLVPAISSKIWVFWTSTRSGTSDLFWETVSPNFAAD